MAISTPHPIAHRLFFKSLTESSIDLGAGVDVCIGADVSADVGTDVRTVLLIIYESLHIFISNLYLI
jgi:hypothetical protein